MTHLEIAPKITDQITVSEILQTNFKRDSNYLMEITIFCYLVMLYYYINKFI